MKCGAKNKSCLARFGKECREHIITNTPSCKSRVPVTNADRIRVMNDRELADWLIKLSESVLDIKYCQNLKACDDDLDAEREIPQERCVECMIDWLGKKQISPEAATSKADNGKIVFINCNMKVR